MFNKIEGASLVGLGKILKAIEIIFLIAIILSTTNAFVLAESKTYFFSATMSPTEVNINQLSTYSVNITNIGTGTLGSLIMYIPSGFTVYPNVTILAPTSSWNYLLSTSSINLTANSMNSAISSGESLIFIFSAIASSNVGINTWTTEAKSNAGWVGASLSLNGVQPTVTVDSQLVPPTVFATISTINQGQVSYISQLLETSGGTLPYTYQWLKSSDGVTYSPIALANGSNYVFSTLPSTPIGTWSFKLVVTDSSPIPKTVTSNSASVIVNSALAAPEVTATPNTIIQTQSSILSSSFMTTGTSPYSFQWFLKGPSGDFITVGNNSSSYTFTGSTTIGIWTFLLQVTDSVGVSVNSSEVDVIVTSTPVFIINVTQSAHGVISPATKSVILSGNQSFTILPDLGYHVDYVLVDGASVGAITSYTFNDVIEDHNISATFKIDQYVILASSGPHGSITPSGTVVVNWNATQSFAITPDASHNIVDVMVDGNSVGSLTSYVFTQIVANHTINVTFAADTFTVTVSQSANGQIVPGTTNVNYNGNQSFTITANPGYYTVDVAVNGSSVGAVSSFTFTNIQNAYDISATFAPISSPTPSASPISSPTPSASPISSPTPSASPISSPTP